MNITKTLAISLNLAQKRNEFSVQNNVRKISQCIDASTELLDIANTLSTTISRMSELTARDWKKKTKQNKTNKKQNRQTCQLTIERRNVTSRKCDVTLPW